MRKIKEIMNSKKAITLISLVITIVIIVILAAVAINMAIGNNGLINKAKMAKQEYINSADKEEKDFDKFTNDIDGIIGNRSGTNNFKVYVDNKEVKAFPSKDAGYYPGIAECSNGAKAVWDYKNWGIRISNLSSLNIGGTFNFYSKKDYLNYINTQLAIDGSKIGEVLDNFEVEKVPIMSSASQNGYVITGSSSFASNNYQWAPYRAFDGNTTDSYTFFPITSPGWVCVKFPYEVAVYKFNFIGYGSNAQKKYKIYSSTNGTDWTLRTNAEYQDAPLNENYIYLNNTGSAMYWKFETININQYYNLQFYGIRL